MNQYRRWTAKELNQIVDMRKDRRGWGEIARVMHDSRENVRAAYRRLVGGKEGSYLDKEERNPKSQPVVAVMDIETLPMITYTWGMFDQNISGEQVVADSCMLSWAGRYLDSPQMHSDVLTPDEAKARDTKRIALSCWEFLKRCDVVIGHNFQGFDAKYINTEFLKWGLPPLKFVIVDTLLVARQNFRFSSNKMKFINEHLGIRNKIENDGFPLWRACSEGDAKALQSMLEYNEGDIGATEELWFKVRPYVRNMNVALYNELTERQCPVCGSMDLHVEGWYYTPAGMWESIRCEKCGCLARGKTNYLDKAKKKALLVNS